MGDFCVRYLAQIFSFFVWVIGSITSIVGKYSHAIDDSISIAAGLIGVVGGVVWLSILRIKKRNEKLEYEIKKQQLKNLSETEI
jgi:membrane protein YdbS with pleckstrin-like domain